jgi:hypothetical protein
MLIGNSRATYCNQVVVTDYYYYHPNLHVRNNQYITKKEELETYHLFTPQYHATNICTDTEKINDYHETNLIVISTRIEPTIMWAIAAKKNNRSTTHSSGLQKGNGT